MKRYPLNHRVETKVTSDEYRRLKVYCNQHQTTHSKIIRNFLDNLTSGTKIPPRHKPNRKIKKGHVNPVSLKNLHYWHLYIQQEYELAIQVSRVGNNLNQIARRLNTGRPVGKIQEAIDRARKVVTGAEVLDFGLNNYFKQEKK